MGVIYKNRCHPSHKIDARVGAKTSVRKCHLHTFSTLGLGYANKLRLIISKWPKNLSKHYKECNFPISRGNTKVINSVPASILFSLLERYVAVLVYIYFNIYTKNQITQSRGVK